MANPAFNEASYKWLTQEGQEVMTLQGTINKSLMLIALVIAAAVGVWNYAALFLPFLLPIVLVAFVLSLVIIYKKETAPYLAPVYALIEWVAIGTISVFYETQLPGIVIQAVTLTFAVSGLMLFLYKARIIVVTEKFRSIIMTATGAIMIMYLISLLGNLTWWFSMPFLHSNGAISIGISVFITGIAAFNLLLDFDVMEQGVAAKAPKYMEWYASFGLLITLVWLYLEILRLLSKFRSR